MALSENLRLTLLAAVSTLAAFFVFGGGRVGTRASPTLRVPEGSFLVATVDVAELRRSPIHDAVFSDKTEGGADTRLARALGVGDIAKACGFDPTTRVQSFALAVPEEGERGEFGVAARVDVTNDELERCIRALTERRGTKASTSPKRIRDFAVLEPDGTSGPRLAYGQGGVLVVAKGAWFDAMLDAIDGTGARTSTPRTSTATQHEALRKSLTSREGWRSPTLVVTALLPRSLRERLRGEMGAELDGTNAPMAGVLGVSAVGVAVRAGAAGQQTEIAAELTCDGAGACEAIENLVRKKRFELSKELALRMLGLGPLVDSIETKREGTRVRVTASASAEALGGAVDRALKLRGTAPRSPSPPPPLPPHRQPTAPDETIPPTKPVDGKNDAGAATPVKPTTTPATQERQR